MKTSFLLEFMANWAVNRQLYVSIISLKNSPETKKTGGKLTLEPTLIQSAKEVHDNYCVILVSFYQNIWMFWFWYWGFVRLQYAPNLLIFGAFFVILLGSSALTIFRTTELQYGNSEVWIDTTSRIKSILKKILLMVSAFRMSFEATPNAQAKNNMLLRKNASKNPKISLGKMGNSFYFWSPPPIQTEKIKLNTSESVRKWKWKILLKLIGEPKILI